MAIIYLDPVLIKKWCLENDVGMADEDLDVRILHPEVYKKVQGELAVCWKANKLNSLERVGSNFELVSSNFEDVDILTPTMKIKRKAASDFFSTEIDRIYASAEALLA